QRPLLEENQRKTQELVEKLKKENAIAEVEEKEATEKEHIALEFDAQCTAFLINANIELKKVIPLIDRAKNSILKVKKPDLDNLKNYKTFNAGTEKLLEGLLIFKLGIAWRTKEFLFKS